MLWLYIFVFAASCAVLAKSGAWLVKSLTRIARYLQMTEFAVAFILMAFATTLPEFFVGVTSALSGRPELSFGNVFGSNIINLSFVAGMGALVAKGLKCQGRVIQRISIYTLVIAFLPILLMLDGSVSRVDGIILLLALAFYMQRLFYQSERFTKVFSNHFLRDWQRFKLFLKDLFVFVFSLGLLLLSAKGVVWSSVFLASALNLPLVVLGTLIVAFGTNLPEIVFGIKAIAMGHKDMILGNLLGAVVSNSTLVLGVTVLISPLTVPSLAPYLIGIFFVVAALIFFITFSITGWGISRREALFLLLLYAVFVVLEIWWA